MKLIYLISLFCCFLLSAKSQKNEINIVIGAGPSYFFNDKTIHHRVDQIIMIGCNFLFNQKNRAIVFNPGISFSETDYKMDLSNDRVLGVTQEATNLNLDILMRISKKNYLRVGLLLSRMEHSSISVEFKQFSGGIYNYSTNETYDGYSCSSFQASAVLGISLPFMLFKRPMKFDINLCQTASRLVNDDFYFNDRIFGEKIKVIDLKSRPTKLVIALEINLLRKKKLKKEEDI